MAALLVVIVALVLLVLCMFALAVVIDGAFGGGVLVEVREEPPRRGAVPHPRPPRIPKEDERG